MKQKQLSKIFIIFLISIVFIISAAFCCPRFVFLSPSCFSDNEKLTEQENYFIKKIVLEAVEDRLSVFANNAKDIYNSTATENEIIQLDKSQYNRKHLFVVINSDFMDSVVKNDDGYRVSVKTYGMESFSDDCLYEIQITKDFTITFLGLDP